MLKPKQTLFRSGLYSCAVILGAAAISLSVIACSKSSGGSAAGSSSKLRTDALLQQMPADQLGYVIMDLTNSSYLALKDTVWNKQAESFNQTIPPSDHDDRQQLELLTRFTSKPEFIKLLNESIAKAVAYITPGDQPNMAAVGALLLIKPGVDTAAAYTSSLELFQAEGYISEKKEDYQGVVIETLKAPYKESAGLNFAKYEDRVLFGSNTAVIKNTLDQIKSPTPKPVPVHEGYAELNKRIPSDDTEYFFGFVNLRGMASVLPEQIYRKVIDPEDNPIRAFLFSRAAFNGAPHDQIAASLIPEAKVKHKVELVLQNKSDMSAFNSLPSTTVAKFGLDGQVLNELLKMVGMVLQTQGLNIPFMQDPELTHFASLSVGIAPAQMGIVPEVLLVAKNPAADKLAAALKGLISEGLQKNGMLIAEWQTKEINSVNVQYYMSPLGAGAYLAASNGILYLSTSEAGMTGLLSSKQPAPNGAFEEALVAPANFGVLTVDFSNSAKLAESLASNFAVFTGGQELLPKDRMDVVKALGSWGLSLQYYAEDKIIVGQSIWQPPVVKK